MKKLLITTLAAVSVGLCAKADDTGFISGTSFEGLTEGDVFNPTDTDRYWTIPTDTDDVFKITNVTYSADATKQHWDWTDGEKALSIDTANPILRNVNLQSTQDYTYPAQDVSETPVFFDSVVQFTATDVAPSMENNTTDKLAVWLYQSPEDVSDTNPGLFGETLPITKVAVTAGYLDGATLKTKNYITNIDVEPDTWHRLTIKSFVISGRPWYSVWVDKTPVNGKADINAEEGLTEFLSMVSDGVNSDTYTKLQGVAFDGKGAVDDIVFTTTAPEFAKEQKFVVTLKYESSDKLTFQNFTIGTESVTASNGGTYEIPIGAEFSILLSVESGNTLSIQEDIELLIPTIDQRGRHILTFTPTAVGTGTIEIKVNAPGDVVTYPTVKPNGDSTTQGTLSESAVAAIEAALAGVETMPDALTVIVNEKEYFGDEAVAKINEVVAMFKAAKEGETLKFFNDKGEMIVSFKAKNPLMETETAEATDYEAKVGETTAAVTSDYTVNKESVDLILGVAGENEAVTFKLVIKPVSSTGSDTGSAVQE